MIIQKIMHHLIPLTSLKFLATGITNKHLEIGLLFPSSSRSLVTRALRQSYHSRLSCAAVLSALLSASAYPARLVPYPFSSSFSQFFVAICSMYSFTESVRVEVSLKFWGLEATFPKFFYPALYLLKLKNLIGVSFEGLRSVFGCDLCLDYGFMRLRFWWDSVFWTLVLYYLHVSTVSEVFLLYL
jgi:hypothetical protein